VCGAPPRIGPDSPDSAADTPASKPCSPRESVLAATRPWPGMVGRHGRCSPGLFPSKACSSIPWVRCRAGTYAVGCEPVPRAPSSACVPWPLVFARSKHRPWSLESTVRRRERSIIPAARLTVEQRPCWRAPSRSARPPVASLGSRSRARELSPPPLVTDRDVLPAPPLGGAPHLPRPLPDAALRACPVGPRRCSVSVCQSVGPFRDRPALVGFCPSSTTLASSS